MNALADPTGFEEAAEPYRFTLDDVFKMVETGILDEDARVELIEGVLVQMSPQSAPHTLAKSRLAVLIARKLNDESAQLIIDATMRLTPITCPEPDLYIYPAGMRLLDARGPDLLLLIEVADSSLRRDLTRKAAMYAGYGIREYWVFDVRTRRTHIHRLVGDLYGPTEVASPDQTLRPTLLPELSLRMADLPPYD